MIDGIKKDCEVKMGKSLDSLQVELAKLRTGRAHASLLDHVMVPYYGKDVPLSQVSSITTADVRTLVVTPWEKNMTVAVEKAIRSSDLGLNPAAQGNAIRVPLPPMTEERRKEMVKVVKNEAENARVAIRNIRRDAMSQLKDALKDKKISEDEEKRAQDIIQKLTDKFVADVEKQLVTKEKELMEI